MRGAPSLGTQGYLTHAGSATITDGGPHRRRRATARGPACAVTAPIRAHDPLQGRHPPVIGRPQAGRPPNRPHSGPLRALQALGGTAGYPLKYPSTPLPGTVGSRIDRGAVRPRPSLVGSQPPPGPRSTTDLLGHQAAAPPELTQPASQPPVAFAAARAAAAAVSAVTAPIRAHDSPGPSSAGNWPSVGRSPSKSASQRPAEGLPGLGGTLGHP